jgi:hypothetical protein
MYITVNNWIKLSIIALEKPQRQFCTSLVKFTKQITICQILKENKNKHLEKVKNWHFKS